MPSYSSIKPEFGAIKDSFQSFTGYANIQVGLPGCEISYPGLNEPPSNHVRLALESQIRDAADKIARIPFMTPDRLAGRLVLARYAKSREAPTFDLWVGGFCVTKASTKTWTGAARSIDALAERLSHVTGVTDDQGEMVDWLVKAEKKAVS